MTGRLKNPVISYQDHTYVSLRDYASFYNKDIEWDEELKEINIHDKRDEIIIHNKETGEIICKAIVNDNYAERLTDTTQYRIYAESVGYRRLYYVLEVDFESAEEFEPDVEVRVSWYTGEIKIKEIS